MSNRTATAEVKLNFQASISNTLDSGAVSTATIAQQLLSGTIQNGVNTGQANRAWAIDRVLGSGANETLDLYQMLGLDIGAGSGNDGLGQACLFEEMVTFIIAHTGGAGHLEIQPGTANPLNCLGSQTVANGGAMNAGGVRVFHEPGDAGFDLSATKRNVKFTATGGAVNYSVICLGRSDDDESSSTSSVSSSSSTSSSSSSLSSSSSSSG